MPAGRPTDYSPQMADRFLAAYIQWPRSVRALCDGDPRLPCEDTIYEWAKVHPEFSEALTRARALRAHTLMESTVADAEDAYTPTLETSKGKMVDNGRVGAARLLVGAKQRLAESWNRDAYGPRPEVSVTVQQLVAFSDMTSSARLAAQASVQDNSAQLPHVCAPDGGEAEERLLED